MSDRSNPPLPRSRQAVTAGRLAPVAMAALLLLGACVAQPTPTPLPVPTPTRTATASATPTTSVEATESAAASPSATPAPPLSLELPPQQDSRVVSVAVEPSVAAEGGQIVVRVSSAADERIDELVLRWPTELAQSLFLAPFSPSADRIRDGGPPLVQDWTKWVIGPGEQGEPAGTTSLGWGPLFAGASLEIPIVVTRRAAGPVAFDLQVLAGNDVLTLDGGDPAEVRVEIP